MNKPEKNILSIPDIILCAIPAFTFTAATDYIESGSFTPSAGFILASCVLFAALLCITYLLRKSLLKVKTEPGSERGIFRFFTRVMQNRFHILIIAIVIFLCWIPALLLLSSLRGLAGIQEAQPLANVASLPLAVICSLYYFHNLPKAQ